MPKRRDAKAIQVAQPRRVKLTAEESLQRMEQFHKRKKAFIAAVRKGAKAV